MPAHTAEPVSKPESPVPGLDPVAVCRWAQRSDSTSPWLHEEVGARMVQRLAWIKAVPAQWLSWEPVTGGLRTHHAVAATYPAAGVQVHACRSEVALAALKAHAVDKLRFWTRWRYTPPVLAQDGGLVDMVWANMALHQTHLPQTLLRQWHKALRVDGFLMFSCLGPDSLKELRYAYQLLGWPTPAPAFTDMHDWGDMLVRAGFAEPVMDMECIKLSYSNASALLADLRAWGRNTSSQRAITTRGRVWAAALRKTLDDCMPRAEDGRLTLTFEIVYGHAHKGKPRISVTPASAVSLQDMRDMLTVGAGLRREGG